MALTIIRSLIDPLAHIQSIAVPGFQRFLTVAIVPATTKLPSGERSSQPAIYALGNLEEPARVFSLRVFHTGHNIPDGMAPTLEFIGSAVSREGQFACHIFQVVRPPAPEPALFDGTGRDDHPANDVGP